MFNRSKKKKSKDLAQTEAVHSAAASPVAASSEISTEIIAVITAAITAMTAAGANGLLIKKINRIHGERLPWSDAGLMECIYSRKF